MPNTKSAKKRLRQSAQRREHNKAVRTRLRTAIKKVRSARVAAEATERFREAAKLLDRAADRGLIHRNLAARSKSRLAAHVLEVGGTP